MWCRELIKHGPNIEATHRLGMSIFSPDLTTLGTKTHTHIYSMMVYHIITYTDFVHGMTIA